MFIDSVDLDHFTCIICFGIARKPVTDPCKHIFNYHCLANWLKRSSVCPLSRSALNIHQARPIKGPAYLFPKVRTKCSNFDNCDWKGTFDGLQPHLDRDCPYELVFCPNLECITESVPRILLNQHVQECKARPMECTACHMKFKFSEISEHFERCPCKRIKCPNKCGEEIMLEDTEHGFHCLPGYIKCVFSELGCPRESKLCNLLDHCFLGDNAMTHLSLAIDYWISKTRNTFECLKKVSKVAMNFRRHLDCQRSMTNDFRIEASIQEVYSSASKKRPSARKVAKKHLKNQKADIESASLRVYCSYHSDILSKYGWECYKNVDLLRGFGTLSISILKALHLISESKTVLKMNNSKSVDDQSNQQNDQMPADTKDNEIKQDKVAANLTMVTDYKDTNFSPFYRCGPIQITDQKTITRVEKGGLALQAKPIVPFMFYQYVFSKPFSAKIGFGICKHEVVRQNHYTIIEYEDHGCYLYFGSQEVLINGNSKRAKTKTLSWIKNPRPAVGFYYDPDKRELSFLDDNMGLVKSLDLSAESDLTNFYPCVYLNEEGNLQIPYNDSVFVGKARNKFSAVYKAHSISLIGDTIYYSNKEAVSFLDWPIISGKPYRFLIVQKISDFMGFGIFPFVRKYYGNNPFDQPSKCHVEIRANGSQSGLMPAIDDKNEVEFKFDTGDIIELTYDVSEFRIKLTNLSTGVSILQYLDESISVKSIPYFGVILDRENDSIRILADDDN